MATNPTHLLHTGQEHHQSGRLDQALACYRAVLESDPQQADALHLTGLALHQQGRHAEALAWIDRAVAHRPDCWIYASSRGCVLHALGRLTEAVGCYERACEAEPLRASPHNNLGSAYQELGRHAEAEAHYRRALAIDADYADAHYNLANLLRETGRRSEAIEHYETAIRLRPAYCQAHVNLGNMLLADGLAEEAARRYRWALDVGGDEVETLTNLAIALLTAGRFDEAERTARRVLELRPADATAEQIASRASRRETLSSIDHGSAVARAPSSGRITDRRWGLVDATLDEAYRYALARHRSLAEMDVVEGIYREILRQDPRHADATYKLGVLLRQTERPEEALAMLAKSLELDAQRPGAYFHQASILLDQDRKEEAIGPLLETVRLREDFGEAHLNLGAVLERLGRLDEAIPYCRRAVSLMPNSAQAHYNLANVLMHTGDVDECLAEYDRVVAIDPNFAKGQWNRGLTRLLVGDFAEGWKGYEWRAQAGEVLLDQYDLPKWDGSSLAGKTILVHAEQGVGDEIMFNSCLPDLFEQGAQVGLTCDPRLQTLFARSFPGAAVFPLMRAQGQTLRPESGFDCHAPIGTLPYFLRRGWNEFPQRKSYLTADPAQVEVWRKRHASLGPGLKIGISWRAGGKASEQLRRTTSLADWAPLLGVSGVHFIKLQYGDCAADLAEARERLGVTIHDWPESDPLRDLDGFAAQIAALDLVISVGNTTVHTAGALGVPAWAALPAVPGWRWLLQGDSIPWYTTVRLFRQRAGGAWRELFERIADQLRARLADEGRGANQAATAEVEAIFEQALALHETGDLRRAESVYRRVIELDPQHADAMNSLGSLVRRAGRAAEAVDLLTRAVALSPTTAAYRYNLANALCDTGGLEEAAEAYRAALRLEPGFAAAQRNLGVTLRRMDRLDEAEAACAAACQAEPGSVDAHFNLAALRIERGDLERGEQSLRAALAIDANHVGALTHLAGVRRAEGDLDEALALYDRALRLRPEDGEARTQRGMILLQQGRLEEGWREYEWRWRSARPPAARTFARPRWEGRPIPGETLLVFGEQGLSDEILFASCVPDAMRQARRVVLECAPRLEKLFARSFPGVEVVARTPQSSSDAAVDYVIPSGSLPRHFRRTLSDFPRRPYLVADERAAAAWAERLAALSSAPKIGIAWRGSGETPGQAIELAALTRALPPEAELISLQPGDTATEIAGASHAARPIHRWIDLAPGDDLDALAALLSRLDLVISIPNVMAHVAGALGRPTWTLIPWAPSWQWFAGIDRSPWYAEMRLWRQTARNDWGGALRALGEEARRWLQSRPRTIEAEPSPASMRSAAIPGPHFVNPNFRESAHDPGRKPLRAP